MGLGLITTSLAALALLLSGAAEARFASASSDSCGVQFLLSETLGPPHKNQFNVRVITRGAETLRLAHSTTRAGVNNSPAYIPDSSGKTASDDAATDFEVGSLTANTAYFYRIECLENGKWRRRPIYTLTTLPNAGTTFSFIVGADGHHYPHHVAGSCGTDTGESATFLRDENAFLNIMGRRPRFYLEVGDTAHPHCGPCNTECFLDGDSMGRDSVGETTAGGAANDAATAQAEAEVRYRLVLRKMNNFMAFTPFVFALGNHDGETGFGDDSGSCHSWTDMLIPSRAARQKYLFNANGWYPHGTADDEAGNYYSFDAGNMKIWVMDPYGFSGAKDDYPQVAEDHDLGAAQLTWLTDEIGASSAKFKMVVSHIQAGGIWAEGGSPNCYHYGRGWGVTRTCDTGGAYCECDVGGGCQWPCAADACSGGAVPFTAAFRGDQGSIQTALANNVEAGGANFHVYGHDHVAAIGEKSDGGGATEVHYILAGQLGGNVPGWQDGLIEPYYDFNADGNSAPDYRTAGDAYCGGTGSCEPVDLGTKQGTEKRGFFLVTVSAAQVQFDYVENCWPGATVCTEATDDDVIDFTYTAP